MYRLMYDISDKFCAPVETINNNACYSLQKESEVLCLRVEDSTECAIRLAEGKADFGVFNAEELILAYPFYQSEFVPIKQLRHKDKLGGMLDRICRFNLSTRFFPKL